jgi:hypothetical protein
MNVTLFLPPGLKNATTEVYIAAQMGIHLYCMYAMLFLLPPCSEHALTLVPYNCCADGHAQVLHVRDAVPPHPLKRTCYHQQPMIGEGSQRVTPASPGDGAADLWGTGKEGEGDSNNGEGNGMVNLTYDPMLNCYYDHDTQQYYEL